jgi:hypothetical protein
MKTPTDKLSTNVFGMLVAVVGFAAVAIYATIAFSAHDVYWFLTGFDERPERVLVYRAGQRTELEAGQPGFDELAEAVRASLAQGVARQSGIGLSEGSLRDAYDQYVTVEAFFVRPVKLHAWFNTDSPTQMLFPITGRHSELYVAFLGDNGKYMSDAPALKTVEPIRSALKSQGLLP